MRTNHFLKSRRNNTLLGLMSLTIILLSACLQQQSSQSSEDALLDDVLDATVGQNVADQEFALFSDDGSYQVFQRVYLDVEPLRSESVRVEYASEGLPTVMQELKPSDTSRMYFLIPPIATDENAYVNVSVDGGDVGHIFVEALPQLGTVDRDPGEFSLIAANSLLFGLRNDLESFKSLELAEQDMDSASSLRALFMSQAIEEFQQLILQLNDAIVFGEPLTGTSSVLLSQELVLLDRLYAQLLLNVSNSGVFLDGASPAISFDNAWDVSTIGTTGFFNTFYSTAKRRYSTLEGVRSLSTLLVGSDDLSTPILNMVVGSVIPAIAAQVIRDENSETAAFLNSAYELLEPELDGDFAGLIAPQYERSRLVLKTLADQIATLEATEQ